MLADLLFFEGLRFLAGLFFAGLFFAGLLALVGLFLVGLFLVGLFLGLAVLVGLRLPALEPMIKQCTMHKVDCK